MSNVSIEDGETLTDIPAEPSTIREPSVRSGVADLPSVDEVRNDPSYASGGSWTKRKIMIVGGGIIVLLAIIVGVSVGVSNKNKSEPSTTGSLLSDEAQRARVASVATFLIDEDVSFEDQVTTPGSPQNRAAAFMAIDDAAQLEVPEYKSAPDAFKFLQRYALAVFYYAMGGESWDFALNFLTPDETCIWFQTLRTTTGQRNNFGAQCNNEGHVSTILIPWNNMVGTIPHEIGLLTELQFLAIPANKTIYSSLPNEMSKLTKLEFFHVAGNALDGPVPEWIGDLTMLSSLALSDNSFQGSIPSTMRNLDGLRFLAMDGNALYGQLDVFEKLSNLQFLYLEHNQFEQTLNSDTLRELTQLQQLDLSDNMFSGPMQDLRHLLHMPALDVLDLSDNLLTGKLPATIPQNSALNFLFLHGNQITEEIPSSLRNLTELNHLDLAQNNFTGAIPSFLGNITNLVYLFLSHNDFDKGPIPDFLPQLSILRDLSLKKTQRNGTIPTFIGELQSLLLLDLDQNELSGPLPTELGALTYLGLLLLNRNQLTGTIPTEVSNMGNLGKVWMCL